VPTDSSFDRYLQGEDDAMSVAQIRGMHGFIAQGCSRCHSGPMLSDFELPRRSLELTDPAQPGSDERDPGSVDDLRREASCQASPQFGKKRLPSRAARSSYSR